MPVARPQHVCRFFLAGAVAALAASGSCQATNCDNELIAKAVAAFGVKPIG